MLLAIDIGGTKLAVGVADERRFSQSGTLERIAKEPIPSPGTPDVVIARIVEIASELRGSDPISSIGISIGGPLDHSTGTVINFPHLPDWKNIPLAAIISQKLDAPARLDNDANLGALAEARWGAGRGFDDIVYLTISTGIGGGVIIGGKLLHGVGSGAGEVGHITVQTDGPLCPCGNRGCLERMASGTHIAGTARERSYENPERGRRLLELVGGDAERITSAHVLRAAKEGDELATEVWDGAARYIAIGLGSIIHVVAPQRIILGGGVSQAGEDLLQPVRRHLRDHVHYIPLDKISVVAAELGHDSALTGAAEVGRRDEG